MVDRPTEVTDDFPGSTDELFTEIERLTETNRGGPRPRDGTPTRASSSYRRPARADRERRQAQASRARLRTPSRRRGPAGDRSGRPHAGAPPRGNPARRLPAGARPRGPRGRASVRGPDRPGVRRARAVPRRGAVRRGLLRGVSSRAAVRDRAGRTALGPGGRRAARSGCADAHVRDAGDVRQRGAARVGRRLSRRAAADLGPEDDPAQGGASRPGGRGTRTAPSWATCARSTCGSRSRAAATSRRAWTSFRAGSTRSWPPPPTRRCSTTRYPRRRPRRRPATSGSHGRSSSPATRSSSTSCSCTRPARIPSMPKPRFAIESWFFGGSAFPGEYGPIAV